MRKLLTILTFLAPLVSFGQSNVTYLEYWFDDDPGVGNGVSIAVTPGLEIDLNVAIPSGALLEGAHTLHVRAQDADGDWSIYESRTFLIKTSGTEETYTPSNASALEYFFNDDPGLGNGTPLTMTPGAEFEADFTIPEGGLPLGINFLHVRGQDTDGDWGIFETRVVLIQNSGVEETYTISNVVAMEYFFNNDPGLGNGTPLAMTPGAEFESDFVVPEGGLPLGLSYLHVRGQDADGDWGVYETRKILVRNDGIEEIHLTSNVEEIEYFFGDIDPGAGNGVDVPITPAPEIDFTPDPGIDLPTDPMIPIGMNKLTFRAKAENGTWGIPETREFNVIDDCDQPIADFSFSLACAGESVSFTDLSTMIQPDASYRWYLDGDGTIDDTTIGDVTFTYTNPGDYDVSLAIYQGMICNDSIAYTISIKPKPVALFSVQNLESGSPTTFDVVSSNVDPGATWEWDWENDAVVDDNTVGDNTHTYSMDGPYTATLRTTDGLGCESFFSNSFTISPPGGGGGGSPSSDFIVSSICLGESASFIDLSANIPGGSTYSWDFDDDGLEDDATVGSTVFTYPTPGDYTAKLTVDLGGGSMLTTTRTLSVVRIPTVDFDFVAACASETVDFTDLSTEVEAGATYSWDFDGDDVVDDTTVGSTSFSYASSGSYLAKLTIDNGIDCEVQAVRQIVIDPIPTANFSTGTSCVGQEVTFSDLSTETNAQTTYSWDFDEDGIEDSTDPDPSFTYAAAGSYDVVQTITQASGCVDVLTQQVEVREVPVALFTVTEGCQGDAWSFTDGSTNVGGSATYSWDFDGDATEDATTVGSESFSYPAAGDYTVSLTIDNGLGCVSTFTELITVAPDPVPDFVIVGGCVGEEIFLLDNSQNVGLTANYTWDIDGDGTEDSQLDGDVSFVFDSAGVYDISLTIDNGNGCTINKTETVTLHEFATPDFEVLSECFGLPSNFIDHSTDVSSEATYAWDFDGDGVTDDTTVGNNTFTYAIFQPYIAMLTIDNGLGCTRTVEVIVDFRDAAAPDFTVSPSCINVETIFTDQSSELESAAVYSWDFNGDGLEDSAVPGSTSYTYTTPGVYQASLTIFNAELCSATRTLEVEVTNPPDIALGADVELCTEGTVTIDAGSGYTSYFWNDGSTEQTLTVNQFGEYWVAVTDIKGCKNIDTVEVKLKELPEAAFDHNIRYSIDGIVVDFENTTSGADTWSWDFGDESNSQEESPTHIYSEFSFYKVTPYTVCLVATDRCGIQSSYCEDLLLSPLQLDGVEQQELMIYPNPSDGRFEVRSSLAEPLDLWVVTQNGQLIYESQISGALSVDLSEEKAGTYLVILNGPNQKQYIKKLIIR